MSDSGVLLPSRDRTALLVPVGGTLDAPKRAIEAVQPRYVAFLASRETAGSVEEVERSLGSPLPWKRVIVTPDHQDLNATYRQVNAIGSRHMACVDRLTRLLSVGRDERASR